MSSLIGVLSPGQFPGGGSSGPTAEDVFSAEGVEELTISGSTFEGVNVKTMKLPEVTEIPALAFMGNVNLTKLDAPEATVIGNNAFQSASALVDILIPKAVTLGEKLFTDCGCKRISLPLATDLGKAFWSAGNIEEISAPLAVAVGGYGFSDAKKLKKFSLTLSVEKGISYAFRNAGSSVVYTDSELDIDISFANFTANSANYMFNGLTARNLTVRGIASLTANSEVFKKMKLGTLHMPDLVTLNAYVAFEQCTFGGLDMPILETIGSSQRIFKDSVFGADADIVFPALTQLPGGVFEGCTGARSMRLPVCTKITGATRTNSFPAGMLDLYLPGSTRCTLASAPTTAFYNTQLLSDSAGRIHVPAALEEDYKNDTNWSAIASKIVGDL